MAKLTHQGLRGLKAGEWMSDPGARGGGALTARRTGTGIQFYFRYIGSNGKRVPLPLGSWTGTGGELSLENARARARELSARYRAGDRDLREILEAEAREAQREREAAKRAWEAEQAQQEATLGALLDAYSDQLERDGKASARAVRAALLRHVKEPWPKLVSSRADAVTTDDLLEVIARVTDAGHLNEARKLRSYIQSAYVAGIRARQDARSLPSLRALRVTTNPARDLVTVEGGGNARDRVLSVAELRCYWRRICDLPAPDGAMLRFHLLTGGQRVAQLARLTGDDLDTDTDTVRLYDLKGRRKQPRAHDVPLIPAAKEAMAAMQGGTTGPHLFTITAGQSGAQDSTMHNRVRAVMDAMGAAGELERGHFAPSDIRRTVETRLAAEGVSQDIRAQLQSHGLGGVQSRHYDRHDYLTEKRAALDTLHRILSGDSATVTPIRRKGRG